MPNRNREQQKIGSKTRDARRDSKRPSRKYSFQNEPWYVAAARKISAARTSSEPHLSAVSSPPSASK